MKTERIVHNYGIYFSGLPRGVTVAQLVLVQLVWVRIPTG